VNTGYNHKLSNGRRKHRKITKFGIYNNLIDRLWAEVKALDKYLIRVHQKK
jgi:hypothetical protein